MFPRHWIFLLVPLLLAGCGTDSSLKQWLDPDRSFAKLPQPEVGGVNETLEKQATNALAQGDARRAAQFYEQLLGSNKATPEQRLRWQLGLADSLRRMGDADHALAGYDAVLKDHPDNLDAREGRGLTLMAQGKPAEAGRVFSEILKKDGTRWRTLNALGILFVTKDMIPEAMAYYTEALKQSPDNPAILNNVGLSQAVDHNYPRAIEALKQASSLAPADARRKQVDLNLAMVLGVSGDMDGARDVAEKYLDGPALENNLGFYAHLAKDDALAKTYLNMALSHSPTFYERAWENLDIVSGGQKDDNPVLKSKD
jgi:Flp pilus assembly protein TadD